MSQKDKSENYPLSFKSLRNRLHFLININYFNYYAECQMSVQGEGEAAGYNSSINCSEHAQRSALGRCLLCSCSSVTGALALACKPENSDNEGGLRGHS